MRLLTPFVAALACVASSRAQEDEQTALLGSNGRQEHAQPLNVAIIGIVAATYLL